MGITEFIKAKNLGEYLESRKNGQVRERIQECSWLEVLLHKSPKSEENETRFLKNRTVFVCLFNQADALPDHELRHSPCPKLFFCLDTSLSDLSQHSVLHFIDLVNLVQ